VVTAGSVHHEYALRWAGFFKEEERTGTRADRDRPMPTRTAARYAVAEGRRRLGSTRARYAGDSLCFVAARS
jgi:hypothetical protein